MIIDEENQPSSCIGTVAYMAPEVYNCRKEKHTYSFSADVWSFGMILYELMTRERPFHDINGYFDICSKIKNGERPSLSYSQKLKYKPILSIWKKCLNKNPNNRPTSFEVLTKLFNMKSN